MSDNPMYESFADDYAIHAEKNPWNTLYDRPAVLAMAGDVVGSRVLDAGCGSGLYTEELIRRGADVVGCDQSPTLVAAARERNGSDVDLRVHDLSEPLSWIADQSMNLVICALTLHYIDDRIALLREFRRVLAPDGSVVISTHHPTRDWLRLGGSYFTDEQISESLNPHLDWPVKFRRRPLTAICAEFRDAGFLIAELVEPQPAAEMERRDADAYARLTTTPAFIDFRLVAASDRAGV